MVKSQSGSQSVARGSQGPTRGVSEEIGLQDTAYGVGIPYYNSDGSLAPRQRIRKGLDDDQSLWLGEGAIVSYGLERRPEAGYIALVNGESDAWTLWYHDLPALGIPGANQAKAIQPEHLEGISTIYVVGSGG